MKKRRVSLVFVTLGACCLAAGQVAAPSPTPYTPTKLNPYTSYCTLWRTDASYKSTLRLMNTLDVSPIDATVVVYLADGTAYPLPTVHIAASGVSTVDLNAALAQAPQAIQGHMSSFGSASITYRHDWQGVVYGTMAILDLQRSLEYTPPCAYPTPPLTGVPSSSPAAPQPDSGQVLEGLWWRYSANTAGFVALSNTTAKQISVEVDITGLKGPVSTTFSLPARNTTLIDLRTYFSGDPNFVGGLHIAYSGQYGDVQVAAGLEDATAGVSTDLPVGNPVPQSGTSGAQQYAAVGVMVNHQDPMLGFPAQVSFTPYAYFRNVATQPRTILAKAYYMNGKTANVISAAGLVLQPGQSAALPVADLLRESPEIMDFNLVYSYTGWHGDVISSIGSTGASGNYIFPVRAKPVYKSGGTVSTYWTYGGGFDTMYSLWNPETQAQDVLVTLRYAGGSYELPVHLEAHASTMLDVGELVQLKTADRNGNVLPTAAIEGSLLLSSLANQPEDRIDVVLGGGIYNPSKATCGQSCETCLGYTIPFMSPGPFSVLVRGQQQVAFGYVWYTGYKYDVTSSSSWSSNATNVVTVQTQGNANPGLSQGVSAGSTSIAANYYVDVPVNVGQICTEGSLPQCPSNGVGENTPVTVTPPVAAISSIQPPLGVVGYGQAVAIGGTNFGTAAPTITVTGGITVSSIGTPTGGANNGTGVTATFNIPISATGGKVTVTLTPTTGNTTPSGPASFFIQIPTTLVRQSTSGGTAPGGYGPLMQPVNQPVVNAWGVTLPNGANACGVYRNLGYSIVDQQSPPQVVQGPTGVTVNETISSYVGPAGEEPTLGAQTVDLDHAPYGYPTAYADLGDIMALYHTYPTCLATSENMSFTQAFSLSYQGKTFPLSLTNNVSMGNFNGTLKADVVIATK